MKKLLIAGLSIALSGSISAQNTPYAQGYFGEPIVGLTKKEERAFERGLQLFVKRWEEADQKPHNAKSCVSCHSVPMPGGSGMSLQALVNINSNNAAVLQRLNSHANENDKIEVRRTPPLFGLGLIEFAKERKVNGVAQPYFGALAKESSLEIFILKAFESELGLHTEASCKVLLSKTTTPTDKCTPTLSEDNIQDILSFIRFTSAPPRRQLSYDINQEKTFVNIGCEQCHTLDITTSNDAPSPLRNITVRSFTDLKTHDLGTGLRIRTTPLWGINSFGPPYWHDASVNSIENAIYMHKGEAIDSLDKYLRLTNENRKQFLKFISDL
ncbi:di-heme oxidoredictase family protein [Pseudomonas sp. 7-41]|uniref:di-heme oxidoredictase family protein n=1 Tax=Pseudomonas sp. 7-41 TaxID=2898483 RepID=UPI001E2EBA6D|nr:di-heme oxidoredictase family protein [Pseudomonas sp. 7-41]UHG95128.1 hypothetical protein LQ249_15510 [Pseudomonas sp. 7-41]